MGYFAHNIIWATVMKINSKVLALSACVWGATFLAGCSKDSANGTAANNADFPAQAQSAGQTGQPAGTPARPTPSAASNQALPAVLAQDPTLKISQTTTGERIIQSPQAVAPPAYYSPSSQDVQTALADVLVASVSRMKDSPQRNAYYQQQANVLQTLKVSQCSQAPVGQPVTCNISIANKPIQLKLLLTNVGWTVVK